MNDQGKGSTRRPQFVSDEAFADNWERVFGKKIWKAMITQTFTIDQSHQARIDIVLDENMPDDCIGVIPKEK